MNFTIKYKLAIESSHTKNFRTIYNVVCLHLYNNKYVKTGALHNAKESSYYSKQDNPVKVQ